MCGIISEFQEILFPPSHFFKFEKNHWIPSQESTVDEGAIRIVIQPI